MAWDCHTNWGYRKTNTHDITHMWNLILKDVTDELIYKTERDADFESKFKCAFNVGWGRG